ncbi:glycoside hydrolase family 108 protein [Paludibacterium denitrificans]|uniref:glycoside hydrolase family 108 protein n=1 Tax=Paludibacterium denitrificans TaxID=2675226 RepID=UPI001E5FDF19|nr:glycosyl hydrolase 108 family protein [Paludibacterium denitrificans]
MTFDEAFESLIGHEGGYVNNPADPGGETKFGISKRSYPGVDIKSLTLDQAKAIYLRDFWKSVGCDAVPLTAAFDLFDMAVNSGVKRAITTLQTAAAVTADGILGPVTLRAVAAMPGATLVARFNGARLNFMTNLATGQPLVRAGRVVLLTI